VARVLLLAFLLASTLPAQQRLPPPPETTSQEQEPPEEDPDLKPTVYTFNPLEASRNIIAGNFYFKKGNYRAASRRYLEASKWNPTSAEAQLKLAETDEKLRDFPGAREAYQKYLTLATDPKDLEAVKKRLAKLPQAKSQSKQP
jgi:tetratricopeptide (TPR) repeat protein